jgi:hypothetical protein
MSTTLKRASARTGAWGLSGAFTVVGRQELLDCIIAYYNESTLDILDTENRLVTSFKFMGLLDYGQFRGLERLAVVLLLEGEGWFGGFGVKAPRRSRSRKLAVQMIADELREHRPVFCAAVRWLCAEKPESDLVARFNRRLYGLGRWGRYPDIDRTAEKFAQYFEEHGLQHIKLHVMIPDGQRLASYASCTHWVDLFCAFLLRECGGKYPRQMPIKLCRRCGKLFSSTRSDTQFCPGGDCQRKNFWNDERHRDYEFARRHLKFAENCVRRQFGYSIDDLRSKLAKPGVKARLQSIRQRWKDWPQILAMIGRAEKLALGSKRSRA